MEFKVKLFIFKVNFVFKTDIAQQQHQFARQLLKPFTAFYKTDFLVSFYFQRDKALQQRQFATLDLFLESARQQLKLLMDNNSCDVEERENS